MGLIRSVIQAGSSNMRDQYKEYIYCDKIEDEILIKRGQIKNSSNNSQNRGTEGVISNGSIIVINEGQCMILVDNGEIVDFCAEAGEYIYDKSKEPSLFYGKLGKNLIESFKVFGKRITFAGSAAREQRVYYVNLLPILGGKFGTQSPVDYLDSGITLRLAMRGTYKYRVTDPVLFYSKLAGNVVSEFELTEEQTDQFKSDVITTLSPALQKLSLENIPYSLILGIGQTKLTDVVKERLYGEWESTYGLTVDTLNVEAVTPIDDDNYAAYKQIQVKKQYADQSVASGGAAMAMQQRMAGTYLDADGQIEAMPGQNSDSTGSALDMFGMAMMGNMMNNGSFGMNMGNNQNTNQQQVGSTWSCGCGESTNQGNFCKNCGKPKAQSENSWKCDACASANQGKFCMECGSPKPIGALVYKCDKCGWIPQNPENPPKFCPKCGDIFNDEDINS